ncbi:cytochrome c biogenesis protein ResB [Occultella kanbiaonis]|uniref:cytochrome c biogenesis protein ResB n=1 Tax=Occultella kanbiaonis TaxID=2675754 RepID=UPI001E34BDFE|nr:cytochrome c biogenesis protein ResB [Occultella kanbiaonis]
MATRYEPEGLATTDDAADGIEPAPKRAGGAGGAGPSGPRSPSGGAPRGDAGLGVRGWLRWTWRQLTSMRVALLLLLLLAVVALPGAFFPQRTSDPNAVQQYFLDHPDTADLLDSLHLFDVYASPWFSAVYLLLFVSLIGCILPRTWVHLKNLRAEPSRVPSRFTRFDVRGQARAAGTPEQVRRSLDAALGRRYRRRLASERGRTADGETRTALTISAERGFGRETGNLVFHLALVGLLVVTAWGQLVHYRGQVVVVQGDTFVNSPLDFDSFDTGSWYGADAQEPFRVRLDSFESEFTVDSQARDFVAGVTLTETDGSTRTADVRVNHPLETNDTRIYLTGNGFAPRFTVTDGSGEVAFSGAVPFLPTADPNYTSNGVVMVPDANGGERQLGFNGVLLPTATADEEGNLIGSAYPQPLDPAVVLNVWVGDLGLDNGVPQNLYLLDTTNMEQVLTTGEDGTEAPVQVVLRPGESVELPDGLGTITFEDLPRFAAFDVRYDPSIIWMGVFAGLAFAGLVASLFLPRRRIWVRLVAGADGDTVVSAAALARGDDPGLQRELDRVLAVLDSDQAATSKEDR